MSSCNVTLYIHLKTTVHMNSHWSNPQIQITFLLQACEPPVRGAYEIHLYKGTCEFWCRGDVIQTNLWQNCFVYGHVMSHAYVLTDLPSLAGTHTLHTTFVQTYVNRHISCSCVAGINDPQCYYLLPATATTATPTATPTTTPVLPTNQWLLITYYLLLGLLPNSYWLPTTIYLLHVTSHYFLLLTPCYFLLPSHYWLLTTCYVDIPLLSTLSFFPLHSIRCIVQWISLGRMARPWIC